MFIRGPLWEPDSVVYSQYFVPLGLDEPRVD